MGLFNPHQDKSASQSTDIVEKSQNSKFNKNTAKQNNDVHISKQELKSIENILNRDFSSIVIEAMTDDSQIEKLVEIITENEAFKNYKCYHNAEVSHAIVSEVAGLGAISDLLTKYPEITDIGYNGRFLAVETNERKFMYGYRKGHEDEPVVDNEYIERIVNHFALREGDKGKAFDSGNPIFDGFSDNIRISATHRSLSPKGTTMSLRISKPELALNEENFDRFAPQFLYDILGQLILSHANVTISGETGTGKTELQKLLIGHIPFEDKIIMIEDVAETHISDIYPDKDVYSWLTTVKANNKGEEVGISISDHIKNALRNNPKWLIVSETRGAEAYEMYQAILSGHRIITTLHAIDNRAVPMRFAGMASLKYKIPDDLQDQFRMFMNIGVHIKKDIYDGKVFRYMDQLCEFVPGSKEYPEGVNVLFEQSVNADGTRNWETHAPTEKTNKLVRDELNAKFEFPIKSIQGEVIPKYTKLERLSFEEQRMEDALKKLDIAKKQQEIQGKKGA